LKVEALHNAVAMISHDDMRMSFFTYGCAYNMHYNIHHNIHYNIHYIPATYVSVIILISDILTLHITSYILLSNQIMHFY
jgi:hypothetical protein